METARVPCRKIYRAADPRVLPVELAVVHWTASPPRGPGVSDSLRIERWLADDARQTSTHFVVLRDGAIVQAADLTERTWHAGGSEWRRAGRVNGRSIGIDLENVGPVARADVPGGWVDSYHGVYRGVLPVHAAGRDWEPYAAAQIASALELAAWIAHELPVLRDPMRWVGHCDIRGAKLDPGPLFPWGALRAAIAAPVSP